MIHVMMHVTKTKLLKPKTVPYTKKTVPGMSINKNQCQDMSITNKIKCQECP